jgi:Cu-Zn family superoxide dismutase
MIKKILTLLLFSGLFTTSSLFADIVVPMHLVAIQGDGSTIGTITLSQTKFGLLLTPHLSGLTPGPHGFHVHQNPSCDDSAKAAGDHLDPKQSQHHQGPYADGHLGDLGVLMVDKDGKATIPVLAPRLKLTDVQGHSLMIHEHGDNYSDHPEQNGGGGARIVCGVIK